MAKSQNRVGFQGEPVPPHLAARDAYARMEALACPTFEDALAAVKTGEAKLAMIPIENSVAGRVADIHHLLPHSGLYIVAETFRAGAAPALDPSRVKPPSSRRLTAMSWHSANAARQSAR